MKKLKCFIACAFGKQDVDQYYKEIILKTLSELQITPLRVDKINHNDNIDQKIINLINKADFGITDLSYARPSVYYEAGYLEGQKKPVIYTSRSDHFVPQLDDIYGNFRIHFDLITKNIIDWDSSGNLTNNKLKSRIRLIVKPIIQKYNVIDLIESEKNDFSLLSVQEKIKAISKISQVLLKKSIKNIIKLHDRYGEQIYNTTIKKQKLSIIIITKDSMTKNDFWKYHTAYLTMGLHNKYHDKYADIIIVLFFTLKGLRSSNVDSSLSWCSKTGDKEYYFEHKNKKYKYFLFDKIQYASQVTEHIYAALKI